MILFVPSKVFWPAKQSWKHNQVFSCYFMLYCSSPGSSSTAARVFYLMCFTFTSQGFAETTTKGHWREKYEVNQQRFPRLWGGGLWSAQAVGKGADHHQALSSKIRTTTFMHQWEGFFHLTSLKILPWQHSHIAKKQRCLWHPTRIQEYKNIGGFLGHLCCKKPASVCKGNSKPDPPTCCLCLAPAKILYYSWPT